MIDMHIHSIYSDGEYTPSELVEKLHNKGVEIFSLTDHDTFKGCAEAEAAASKYEMEFIRGTELSTQYNGIEIHMLGYNFDTKNKQLLKLFKEVNDMRIANNAIGIEFVQSKGYSITMQEVRDYAKKEIFGRPHIARVLVQKGYFKSVNEVFNKLLGTPEYERRTKKKIDTAYAVKTIIAADGIPVMAHPVLIKTSMRTLEKIIAELKNVGLMGLECRYSKNSPQATEYFLGLAERFNLIHTGGSDFHGEHIKPEIELATGINGSLDFREYKYIEKYFLKNKE